MGETKELNIKNQTYYFFDDMINIKNFHSNLKSRMKTLIFTMLVLLLDILKKTMVKNI